MKHRYAFLNLLLLVLIPAIATGGVAPAESASKPGFEVTVGGGWGHDDQSDINSKYIDGFAEPVGLLDEHLSRRAGFFGEWGFVVSSRHTLSLGLTHTSGRSANDMTVLNIGYDEKPLGSFTLSTKLTASAFVPHVRLKYVLVPGEWSPFLCLGVAYTFGRLELEQGITDDSTKARLATVSTEYTADGWGWFATLGVRWALTGPVSLGVEGGYRRLLTGDLEDEDGEVWRFDGSTPAQAIRLDFSGWFVIGTVTVGL